MDLLRQTFDLMSELDGANEDSDFSYIHQPSIAEHEQNHYYEEWTPLVALFVTRGCKPRSAMLIERDLKPSDGRAIDTQSSGAWLSLRRPSHSSSQMSVRLAWLLERDGWWLWTSETQREALELLTSLLHA